MTRILMVRGRNNDTFFLADTPEREAAAQLSILQSWDERGSIAPYLAPVEGGIHADIRALAQITDEAAANLPDEVRNQVVDAKLRVARYTRAYEQEAAIAATAKEYLALVKDQGMKQAVSQINREKLRKVFNFFETGEYQEVRVAHLNDPLAD